MWLALRRTLGSLTQPLSFCFLGMLPVYLVIHRGGPEGGEGTGCNALKGVGNLEYPACPVFDAAIYTLMILFNNETNYDYYCFLHKRKVWRGSDFPSPL